MSRKVINTKKFMNVGVLVFVVILIYLTVCVVTYFRTNHIIRYEVKEGILAQDNTYRGIILREEQVVPSQASGYIFFYANSGTRVAKNNPVYSIDETGSLKDYLDDLALGENTLSKRELAQFRAELVDYMHDFDERDFDKVYQYKKALSNVVLRIANENMISSIGDINNMNGGGLIKNCVADDSGIVTYWTDGYENFSAGDLREEHFKEEDYTREYIMNNTLVAEGETAYKICNSENWKIVIPVTPDRAAKLAEEKYVKVKFLKNQYESWAETGLVTGADGKTYIELKFNNSMVTFVAERFLDIEINLESETGLKIPASSIVQKEFFLIPEEYIITNSSGRYSILTQGIDEEGNMINQEVVVDVYNFDENSCEYYLDANFLEIGQVLYAIDRQKVFTVSKRATLIGVYNVNKGYADFKQITILSQNDEYAIVKTNTMYGLRAYDYIALNADSVVDDQFITN